MRITPVIRGTAALVAAALIGAGAPLTAQQNKQERKNQDGSPEPLVIARQGNRTFGGRVVVDAAAGTRLSCDHGYVNFQIPQQPRRYPLLMVHASSKRTWEPTWDGHEGFRDIFLRRGYSTWITDLPRTGQAGQGCGATSYTPTLSDKSRFNSWRLGLWFLAEAGRRWYSGVQFPTGNAAALNQFSRIQTPEFNAPENEQVETDALAVLLDEIGPSVVLTHSSTGIRGWITGLQSNKVPAIVSYEPGAVWFPEGEVPPPVPRADGATVVLGRSVPMAEFLKLTKFPIQILWGDYIPKTLDPVNVGERLT